MLLDAREACSFSDYFVICSGETNRQIKAIRDEIGYALKKEPFFWLPIPSFANIFANELFTTTNDKVVPNGTTLKLNPIYKGITIYLLLLSGTNLLYLLNQGVAGSRPARPTKARRPTLL